MKDYRIREVGTGELTKTGAAVVIEPVSADSHRKTGIFADTAGDFRPILACFLNFAKSGVRKRQIREKPGFPAYSRVYRGPRRTPEWLAGAGGIEPPNGGIKTPGRPLI